MCIISQEAKREAIVYMQGYYIIQLWAVDGYSLSEESKEVLRSYNQEMIDKYDSELLVHDLINK